MENTRVEEVQGLYGPFSLSERVVQKLWMRQEFMSEDLRTTSGKRLEIISPGRWNLLDGPDFKEARLAFDGVECVADVEVHFYVNDWFMHAHGANSNYDSVGLHVVLFPERDKGRPVRCHSGKEPECLYLLPCLDRDLESIALDEALIELEQVDTAEWISGFYALGLEEKKRQLERYARQRWQQKVRFARKRLEAAGNWSEACHQLFLEVLGYARNRAPMGQIALRYPYVALLNKGALDPQAWYKEVETSWRLSGLRPANHPKLRLEQYSRLLTERSDWPVLLKQYLCEFGSKSNLEGIPTGAFRRGTGLVRLQNTIREKVLAEVIGVSRFNTFMVDAALPLAEAAGFGDFEAYWMHWFPGDVSDACSRFIRGAELISRASPRSNGLNQGCLGLFLAQI